MNSHVPQYLKVDGKWLNQIGHIFCLSFLLDSFEWKTHFSKSITEFLPLFKVFFERMQTYFLKLIGFAACSSSSRCEFGFYWPTDWTFWWDIVPLGQEMLPSSLDEDDRIIEGPYIVDVLKLHIEHFEIVGLWIFRGFPVFKEICVNIGHWSIEEQIITAFLDVNNAIVDKFKWGDIVDNGVLYLRVSFHGVVMVCKVQQRRTRKDTLDSFHASQLVMMQLQHF